MKQTKKSPMPRLGGKSLMAERLIKMFPPHRLYCEVFCGGASVFFRKEESRYEVLNDIDHNLITYFRVVKERPFEFLQQFRLLLASRAIFNQYKEALSDPGLTDVERAAFYYYVVKLSFGGMGSTFGVTTTTKTKLNLVDIDHITLTAYQRLRRVTIECLDWRAFIPRYDREHTLFYLDPPYRTPSSRAYPSLLTDEDYRVLSGILSSIKGKFLLSINKDEYILDLFSDFVIEEIETTYSVQKDTSTPVTELLIKNF